MIYAFGLLLGIVCDPVMVKATKEQCSEGSSWGESEEIGFPTKSGCDPVEHIASSMLDDVLSAAPKIIIVFLN